MLTFIKSKPRSCYKCRSIEDIIIKKHYRSPDYGMCKKCISLQCYALISTESEIFYIFHNAIEEKGIEWYKKARDKFLKKEKIKEEKIKEEEIEYKNKIIKKIEAWK